MGTKLFDACVIKTKLSGEHLVGVFAKPRHAYIGAFGNPRHLDGVADRQIFSARRMIDLDDGAGLAQRIVLGDSLPR